MTDKGRLYTEYSRNIIISDAKSLEDLYNTAANTTNRVIGHALMQLQGLDIKVRIVPRAELMDVDMFPRVLHQPKDATVGQVNALFVEVESMPPLLSEQWARELTGHTDTEMSLSDARGSEWQQATAFIGAVAAGMSIDLAAEQSEDPECDFVIRFLRGELNNKQQFDARFALMPERAQRAVQAYRGQDPNFKRLSMVDGRLMSLEPDVNWKVPMIPFKLRERFVRAFHNSSYGAHRGRDATIAKLKSRGTWFGRSSSVASYIKRCLPCLETKASQIEYGGLAALRVSSIGDVIAYDLIGPLKTTPAGNVYIGLATELVSGYVMLKALKSKAGIGSAKFLLTRVIFFFGQFTTLQVDGAPDLCKGIVKALMDMLEIKLRQTPAYSPIVNGGTERRNGTAGVLLRILSNEAGDDWDSNLRFVEYGINNALSHNEEAVRRKCL